MRRRTGAALLVGGLGEIDPLAYLRGLAAAVERLGGVVRTGVHVQGVEETRAPVVLTWSWLHGSIASPDRLPMYCRP